MVGRYANLLIPRYFELRLDLLLLFQDLLNLYFTQLINGLTDIFTGQRMATKNKSCTKCNSVKHTACIEHWPVPELI